MYSIMNVFLLTVMTGSSWAVFYYQNAGPDYPRLGKRAYYSGDKLYPRLGRRDAPPGQTLFPATALSDLPQEDKRGVFTKTAYGYPRTGRRSAESMEDSLNDSRSQILEKIALIEEDEARNKAQEGQGSESLDILFLELDSDNDGKITKDEFTTGMSRYRSQNPFC
ncbi:LOW QUALITY PROTEIN: HCS2 neuropeptides-like [Physella acuta]|uniref:LOW QUALITY PROTEIN: HCS2 neuropeptides-like n=1 Tax=Physella acuta TaxID=109671 RepID=UPI0027DDF155|nr:LOW QUALITY PROTEIN: HCS2 neuropeptides-like [Physella acuta]